MCMCEVEVSLTKDGTSPTWYGRESKEYEELFRDVKGNLYIVGKYDDAHQGVFWTEAQLFRNRARKILQ